MLEGFDDDNKVDGGKEALGRNKDLLAIVVVEGPWTAETLRVMAKVYDYVIPLNNVFYVAGVIYDYLQGDRSRLRWLIDFSMNPADSSLVEDSSL